MTFRIWDGMPVRDQRKVVEQHDLGTHTLFIAEVVDAKLINENAPLTYADYQTKVKPKAEPKAQDKKIVGWRCRICNYVYEGSELPADFTCPIMWTWDRRILSRCIEA